MNLIRCAIKLVRGRLVENFGLYVRKGKEQSSSSKFLATNMRQVVRIRDAIPTLNVL